ncbi:MAG: type II toxin-antitoxin system prevent-host-death family antitoxin [Thermoanaerobaculia bacterium]
MDSVYSTYEAKAKFSELLRKVRQGGRVVITSHGKPVAELRPIEPGVETLDERIARLTTEGVLSPAPAKKGVWKAIAHRPGALQRFLDDRD